MGTGVDLSRSCYHELVRPVLDAGFSGLPHGAAILGRGSEVLGFDDEMSTDHDWRARVLLFLLEEDHERIGEDVTAVCRELPATFHDRPVDVEVHTVRGFFLRQLGVDVDSGLAAQHWLTLPEHGLRMVTAGAVHHDDVGLQRVRDDLAYYPRDVWLYLLVTGWWRVHPELNLVGRAGYVGDELGSAVIGSRLVSDLMRLCFLMERQYAPYSKWFGTAFARLKCGAALTPILSEAMHARTWPERERALLAAYEALAEMHNALGITEPAATEIVQMWDRPFKVAWADFPGLLRQQIQDPAVIRIADRWLVGPVDQMRDWLVPAENRHVLQRIFDAE